MIKQRQVQQILAKDTHEGRDYYLVHWGGASHRDSTWEPADKLGAAKLLLRKFDKSGSKVKSVSNLPTLRKFLSFSDEHSLALSPAVDLTLSSEEGSLSPNKSRSSSESSSVQVQTRVDKILQPFEEEFLDLFSRLRKKIKTDLQGQLPSVTPNKTTKKNVSQNKSQNTQTKSDFKNTDSKSDQKKDLLKKDFKDKIKPSSIVLSPPPPPPPPPQKVRQEQKAPRQARQKDDVDPAQLGSFERGNEILEVVKGMKNQADDQRYYYIKWKQTEGQPLVRDSWVDESNMKEYACKELARFFLSRIKWTK